MPMDSTEVDVSKLDDYFNHSVRVRHKNCKICNKKVNALEKRMPLDILSIEAEAFLSRIVKSRTLIQPIDLKSISRTVRYANQNFILKGVVNCEDAHFTAYTLRNNKWEKFDDIPGIRPNPETFNQVSACLFVYIRDFNAEPPIAPPVLQTTPIVSLEKINASNVKDILKKSNCKITKKTKEALRTKGERKSERNKQKQESKAYDVITELREPPQSKTFTISLNNLLKKNTQN